MDIKGDVTLELCECSRGNSCSSEWEKQVRQPIHLTFSHTLGYLLGDLEPPEKGVDAVIRKGVSGSSSWLWPERSRQVKNQTSSLRKMKREKGKVKQGHGT